MRLPAILPLLAAGTVLTAADPPSPPPGATAPPGPPATAVAFGGHHYLVSTEDLSWQDAKRRCEELGGHLAVITTQEEQAFVTQLAAGRYLFLGATDAEAEDVWEWITGEPFTYTAWMSGQPNNYGGEEHYLATYDDGEWVDVAADGDDFWMPTGFICEWEGAVAAALAP
jgi:hypothetical protein